MRPAVLIALAAVLAGPAAAAEWVERTTSPHAALATDVHGALPTPDGGFLLRGAFATHWYSAQGTYLRSGAPMTLHGGTIGVAAGGIDLQAPMDPFWSPTPDCEFARLGPALDLRQLGTHYGRGYGLAQLSPNPADPAGAQFVWDSTHASRPVFRIDADCHRSLLPFGFSSIVGMANAHDAPGAFVLVHAPVGATGSDPSAHPSDVAAPSGYRLLRIGAHGETLWDIPLPGRYSDIAADAAGVVLAGEGDGAEPSYHVARVDSAGSVAWSTEFALAAGYVVALHGTGTGSAVLWLLHDGEGNALRTTSAVLVDGGAEPIVHDLGTLLLQWRVAGVALPPAWVLGRSLDGERFDQRVVRLDSDGSLQTLLELTGDLGVLFQLEDGRLLVHDAAAAPEQAFSLFDPATAASAPLAVPVPRARSEADAIAYADGLSAVVIADAQGSNRLRALGPDGVAAWERELTPLDVGSAQYVSRWRIAFTGAELCATRVRPQPGNGSPADVVCVSRSDGSITVPLQQVESTAGWPPYVLGEGADRMLLYSRIECGQPGQCTTQLMRRPLQGASLGTPQLVVPGAVGSHAAAPVPVGGNGVALAWQGGTGAPDAIMRVDAAGQLDWTSPLPANWFVDGLYGAPDGRVLRILYGAGGRRLEQLDADGSVDWLQGVAGYHEFVATALADGWAVSLSGQDGTELRRLDAADGTAEWTHRAGKAFSFGTGVLALAQAGGHIAWMRVDFGAFQQEHGTRLEWFTPDGTQLGADALPGGGNELFRYNFPQLLAAGDGVLALLTSGADATISRHQPPPPPQPITSSLLGSWYAPRSNGQGLFLGTLDDAMVYGGWFTYAALGSNNDRADQRWYTLQGTLDADGTAGLDIIQTSGGAFAAGPAPASTVVGTAVLRREDCNHAQLVYRFDAEHLDGAAGAIALQRIASTGCAAAAPTALPTGAFFDPSTSGQGVFFETFPAGPQLSQAALWFTFDPAAAADDPTAQHWFTLGSAPVDASADTVDLTIYRTIGASFDRGHTGNTHRVGTATLRVAACDAVTLAWHFDDTDLAGAFAGLHGEQPLQRIGTCPTTQRTP